MCGKLGSVLVFLLIFSAVVSKTVADDHEPRTSRHRSRKAKEHKKPKVVEHIEHKTPEIDKNEILEETTQEPLLHLEDVVTAIHQNNENTEINLDHEDYKENGDFEHQVMDEDLQDVMIDVKGRNGYVSPEETKLDIRKIPEDYVDSIFKPHDYRMDYFQPRHVFGQSNDNFPFFNPIKRFMFKQHQNLRYSPHYNKGSREIVYPKGSSENNFGQYGLKPYSAPEVCHTCIVVDTFEDNRRSEEVPYLTANGRSLEAEPIGSNSYPFVARGAYDRNREVPMETESHRKALMENDKERFSNIVMHKSGPVVMNRRGLTGYHVYSGF